MCVCVCVLHKVYKTRCVGVQHSVRLLHAIPAGLHVMTQCSSHQPSKTHFERVPLCLGDFSTSPPAALFLLIKFLNSHSFNASFRSFVLTSRPECQKHEPCIFQTKSLGCSWSRGYSALGLCSHHGVENQACWGETKNNFSQLQRIWSR